MRAARLLRLMMLLQNRGRMTSAALAAELEVAPRTILRDLDALTEAGVPVIAHRGAHGGVELGFNYRTRLTGLSEEEAFALGVMLARPATELAALELSEAGAGAREKLLQALPDPMRARAEFAARCIRFDPPSDDDRPDPRVAALARAVREGLAACVTLEGGEGRELHPAQLVLGAEGWRVMDARPEEAAVAVAEVVAIQVSSRRQP